MCISYHRDVVHQEVHQWCKFGESITLNSKHITVFLQSGTDLRTDGRIFQTGGIKIIFKDIKTLFYLTVLRNKFSLKWVLDVTPGFRSIFGF